MERRLSPLHRMSINERRFYLDDDDDDPCSLAMASLYFDPIWLGYNNEEISTMLKEYD